MNGRKHRGVYLGYTWGFPGVFLDDPPTPPAGRMIPCRGLHGWTGKKNEKYLGSFLKRGLTTFRRMLELGYHDNQTTYGRKTMTTNNTEEHDRLYNILQHQGFHEDTIDEMTIEQMREFSSTDVIKLQRLVFEMDFISG